MNSELVSVKTDDDVILHGAFYEGAPESPTILVMHGSQMNFYTGLGSSLPPILAGSGYNCLTANFRGHDMASAPDGYTRKMIGSLYDNFQDCVLDISALLSFVSDRGHGQVFLLGHSQGAFKILYAQRTLRDRRVKGMALISPPPSAAEMTMFMIGRKEFDRALSEAREAILNNNPSHLIVSPARGNMPFIFSAQTYVSFCDSDVPVDARYLCRDLTEPLLVTRGEMDLPPISKALIEAIRDNYPRPDLCRLAELPNASHFYDGQEDALAQLVMNWMTTCISHA